jgi:hypothetical protein
MVRQVLRDGTGSAALDTWILEEVRRTAAEGRPAGPVDGLTAAVAGRLCQAVLDQLQGGAVASPRAGETVVDG